MPLTVRLDANTERALNALAKKRGLSRSDVVREALAQYHADAGGAPLPRNAFDAWQDVVGVVKIGVRRADMSTGEQFAGLVRNAARARRTR
jgi:predicted DNA-binding protein